jgi:hypothetical protein
MEKAGLAEQSGFVFESTLFPVSAVLPGHIEWCLVWYLLSAGSTAKLYVQWNNNNNNNNSVDLVRERTIPTERLPLVGEVSANFCG